MEFENRFKDKNLLSCGRVFEELRFEAVEASQGCRDQTFSTELRNNLLAGMLAEDVDDGFLEPRWFGPGLILES